jgi:hypothetical protein
MWPCTIPVVEEPVCEEKGGHNNHQIQKFADHKTEKVHIVPEINNRKVMFFSMNF